MEDIKANSHSTPYSAQAFASLGLGEIAYVKTVSENGGVAYAIHGADGARLGLAEDRALAFAAARRHDFEPVSVH